MNSLFRSGIVMLVLLFQYQNLSAKFNRKNEPDSVYLFSYGNNGLSFAWSPDKKNWTPIGEGYTYIKSDYGRWGTEKKMISPYLIPGRKGIWECVWQLNEHTLQFAHANSADLVNWGPQAYPYFKQGRNILKPVISYHQASDNYTIVYTDAAGKYYSTITKDFNHYTPAVSVPASAYHNLSRTIMLPGSTTGQIHRVSWAVVDKLSQTYELSRFKGKQNDESAADDQLRFAGLKNIKTSMVLQPEKSKQISNMLTGVFFEDINYAADGGLYAELIQNRDFEYMPGDKQFRDAEWNSLHSWALKGEGTVFSIDSVSPVHANTPHFAVLDVKIPGAALSNRGYDGISVKKGSGYDFSAFIKAFQGGKGRIEVRLVSAHSGILARTTIDIPSSWTQVKASLVPSDEATDVRLELAPLNSGRTGLDLVSLFPRETFMGRKNGLRADLAQAIADIHPRFIRFPGGCVAHGDGLDNIYQWKESIGPLAGRKGARNLWGYHQSKGLGYFEYFQFCEDIGAAPVPVVAAGVPCQNSGTGGGGQQGGIPMDEMGAYIQDIIDLVEYANGDVSTVWGKKRAEAGHPRPFNLKYIGIGNEDQITEVFRERFTMIYKALRKAHPEITIIGTAGPFFEGTDYREGWKIAAALDVPVLDEHYYQSPGWFINNQDFYDRYDRGKARVYLGEYAASLPGGNKTNWETSLAEALYMTTLERNGDVVSMASYAPLLAKEGHTQWNPDLMYFNNNEVKFTTGYYVQQLYGQNAGDTYIPAIITLSDQQEDVRKRIAWSVVKDSGSGDLMIKLVNLLPVKAAITINTGQLKTGSASAVQTTLWGKPADKTVDKKVTEIQFSDQTPLELPAYSFTVLKLKGS